MAVLLRLVAAHFVGDFVLQSRRMATRKHAPRWLAAHAATHGALYLAALMPRPVWELVTAALLLSGVHAAIDVLKVRCFKDGAVVFCIGQATHLSSIVMLASLLPTAPLHGWQAATTLVASPLLYLYGGGYVAVVLGAGHLVQRISGHFLTRIDASVLAAKPGLPEAGQYIWWLERFLIVTALLAGHGEVVGFIVGAKAIVRYPELKGDEKGHLADYFLIGTMTSVGLALAGGLLLLKIGSLLS